MFIVQKLKNEKKQIPAKIVALGNELKKLTEQEAATAHGKN
jgi:hypothetical protein